MSGGGGDGQVKKRGGKVDNSSLGGRRLMPLECPGQNSIGFVQYGYCGNDEGYDEGRDWC